MSGGPTGLEGRRQRRWRGEWTRGVAVVSEASGVQHQEEAMTVFWASRPSGRGLGPDRPPSLPVHSSRVTSHPSSSSHSRHHNKKSGSVAGSDTIKHRGQQSSHLKGLGHTYTHPYKHTSWENCSCLVALLQTPERHFSAALCLFKLNHCIYVLFFEWKLLLYRIKHIYCQTEISEYA